MSEEPDKGKTIEAPVTVVQPKLSAAPPKVGDKNTAPTTTEAEDITKAGQRRINILWEFTQSFLAIMVTAATLFIAGRLALSEKGNEAAFLLLSNAFFSVISVYLTRTNHTKIGGVQSGDQGR